MENKNIKAFEYGGTVYFESTNSSSQRKKQRNRNKTYKQHEQGNGTSQSVTFRNYLVSSLHESSDDASTRTDNASGNQTDVQRKQTSKTKHQKQSQHRSGTGGESNKNIGRAKSPSHPWLTTTLKGHKGRVGDVSYNGSGKFLASCSEASRQHGAVDDEDTTSTFSSGNTSSDDSPKPSRTRRSGSGCSTTSSTSSNSYTTSTSSKSSRPNPRQRKNHRRINNCVDSTDDKDKESQQSNRRLSKSPRKRQASYMPSTMTDILRSRAITPPLKEHIKLNMSESEIYVRLKEYILTHIQYKKMGYPERFGDDGHAMIYKYDLNDRDTYPNATISVSSSTFDVNAREFVPGFMIVNESDGLAGEGSSDSGQESGMSSPQSGDSDEEYNQTDNGTNLNKTLCSDADTNELNQAICADNDTDEHQQYEIFDEKTYQKDCVRCKAKFYVSDWGNYYSNNMCYYHWGKTEKVVQNGRLISLYNCCGKSSAEDGCSFCEHHVWNGTVVGNNGPLPGFVTTKPATQTPTDGNYKVYALDCEMSYTNFGLELVKVTLVTCDGQLAYEKLVKPSAEIVDYNTRFSGITAKHLASRSVRNLKEVQADLLKIINAETILIGHALENDLRVLKMIHRNCIDTSVVFPHMQGLPFRRSLKTLVGSFLHRDIQMSESGHSSFEDSRACLELMLWKVRKSTQ